MEYKDYINSNKTFIVVHNTGFDKYKEQGIVYESDDYIDAENVASKLRVQNNTPEDIRTGWCHNTYVVNVNTLTAKGKKLLKRFEDGK